MRLCVSAYLNIMLDIVDDPVLCVLRKTTLLLFPILAHVGNWGGKGPKLALGGKGVGSDDVVCTGGLTLTEDEAAERLEEAFELEELDALTACALFVPAAAELEEEEDEEPDTEENGLF